MKLFLIGATGRTGREIVQQALERGHQVTAFVRSPESITLKMSGLPSSTGMLWTKTNFLMRCKITTQSFPH